MRKRITLQDKKILIYEIHQGWAREHLEKLTTTLDELFSYLDELQGNKHLCSALKEETRLQLRLLETVTRKIQLPSRNKENQQCQQSELIEKS